MPLAKATPRVFCNSEYMDYEMDASVTIFEGAFVGLNAGYARPLQAGDTFLGVATETKTNGATAGEKTINVATTRPFMMPVTGVTDVTSLTLPVYASADDALTLTEGTNSLVGIIIGYESGSTCMIQPILGSKEVYTDLST